MRRVPWYVYLIGLMLLLYSFALYKRPQKVDWTPTLVNKHKKPYGTYVLYQALDSLFGYAPLSLRVTPTEFCGDSTDIGTKEVYMFIAPSLPFTKTDAKALMQYVSSGNDIFISAEEIGGALSDELKVQLSTEFSMDSISTRLVNPALGNTRNYGMRAGTINVYIKKFDTAHAKVLGMNSKDGVNYIMIQKGEGRIFINTVPGMYTNYSLLELGNKDYVSRSLSYLTADPDGFYWDEYFKQGREGERTPLRVILDKPMLKAAMYTALAALLLFMLFQSKRRQRIIPIVKSPENSTVDFVETVSQVYLNHNNHRIIAMKQVTYLFEHLRSRYGLDTSMPDDAFAQRLAHKTGYPEKESLEMISLIRFVRSEERISDQHLVRLNHYIQEFHKYADQ